MLNSNSTNLLPVHANFILEISHKFPTQRSPQIYIRFVSATAIAIASVSVAATVSAHLQLYLYLLPASTHSAAFECDIWIISLALPLLTPAFWPQLWSHLLFPISPFPLSLPSPLAIDCPHGVCVMRCRWVYNPSKQSARRVHHHHHHHLRHLATHGQRISASSTNKQRQF